MTKRQKEQPGKTSDQAEERMIKVGHAYLLGREGSQILNILKIRSSWLPDPSTLQKASVSGCQARAAMHVGSFVAIFTGLSDPMFGISDAWLVWVAA